MKNYKSGKPRFFYSLLSSFLFFQLIASPFTESMASAQRRPNIPQSQARYSQNRNQKVFQGKSMQQVNNTKPRVKKAHPGTFNEQTDANSWAAFVKGVEEQKVKMKDFENGPVQVGNSVVTAESFKLMDMLGGHQQNVADSFVKGKAKGYGSLMLGMGVTDLVFALMSNDHMQLKEWYESMLSWDKFHMNMVIFEMAMLAANAGGSALGSAYFRSYYPDPYLYNSYMNASTNENFLGSAEKQAANEAMTAARMGVETSAAFARFQQMLSFSVLPLGDMVSSYFMSIWNHPRAVAYRKLSESHTAVIDPDHPDQPPTNSLAVRNKVKSLMRLHLLNDIVAENSTLEKGKQIAWHGLEMGLVAYGYGTLFQRYAIIPLEVTTDNGKTQFLYRIGAKAGMPDAIRVALKARRIFLIESFDIAAFSEAAIKFGLRFKAVGGFFGQVVGFLIANKIVDNIIDPPVERHKTIQIVKDSIGLLQKSVNWYVDPKRTEYLPWSEFETRTASPADQNKRNDGLQSSKRVNEVVDENHQTRDWNWLTFFYKYNGDLNSDFYKKNAITINKNMSLLSPVSPLRSDLGLWEHLTPLKQWHFGDHDAWTFVWVQAFEFMRDFSLRYLGQQVDEAGFYSCQDPLIGNHGYAVPCQEEWYHKNAPLFVTALKNFKTQDYVRARLYDVNQAFDKYRGEILLGDVSKISTSWSKDISDQMQTQARKEHYFIWIARGMSESDPYFVENADFWHPHVDDRPALDREKAQMIATYDLEVLGYKPQDLSICDRNLVIRTEGGAGCTAIDQVTLEKKFIANNRLNLDRSWLVPVMTNTYLKIFTKPVTQASIEQEEVASRIIKNHFEPDKGQAKREKDATLMEKNQHRLRWFLSGFAQTTEFTQNENQWHPTNIDEQKMQAWMANAVAAVLVGPYFLNRDPDTSKEAQQLSQSLTEDMIRLLTNQVKNISEANRDYFTLVTRTYMAIQNQRDAFANEIAKTNEKYQSLIRAALAPTRYQRIVGPWFPSVVDKGTNKFNMPNKTNNESSLYNPSASWLEVYNALPDSSINTFNVQINFYLKAVNDSLNFFNSQGQFSAQEKQNELMGFEAGASYILDRLERLGALLEQNLADPKQFPADQNLRLTLYEAVITAGQMASLISASNPVVELPPQQPGQPPPEDTSPRGRADQLKEKILKISAPYWGDIPAKIVAGKDDAAMNALFEHKRNLLVKTQEQIVKAMTHLQSRGWGYVTSKDEEVLRKLLENPVFSLPLLAVTTGAQSLSLGLASVFGSQIINLENQKGFQSRIGCYLTGDPLCKQ